MIENIIIRNYDPKKDYPHVYQLYNTKNTFWGQYDDARDTEEKLRMLCESHENKILVAEYNNIIVWTVTLFEDWRSAWLYRFAVQQDDEHTIAKKLFEKAKNILKSLWHSQILVYWPVDDYRFEKRYIDLSFNKWNNYTAYWQNI